MATRPFTPSICAYPWDLADEGFDTSLGRIADLARCETTNIKPAVSHTVTEPASAEWIDPAFDGQLRQYIDISRAHLTELWLSVVDLMHDGGAEVHMSLINEARLYSNDLDPSLNEQRDRVCYEPRGDITTGEVEALRAQGSREAKVLYYWDRHFESDEEATDVLSSAVESGCDGATVYNYGLLTERQLGRVGAAVRAVTTRSRQHR